MHAHNGGCTYEEKEKKIRVEKLYGMSVNATARMKRVGTNGRGKKEIIATKVLSVSGRKLRGYSNRFASRVCSTYFYRGN